MQVRALMEAAHERVRRGWHPIIEIMIPLVVTREELALARSCAVEEAIGDVAPGKVGSTRRTTGSLDVQIGTMIETPRAVLAADQIAEQADFFSLGTNDLAQMTFGFSRDDIEGRIMSTYLECGLLARNPFEVVDDDGVGTLVRMAITKGRSPNPTMKVGVCGEHRGDPASIAVFLGAGVDYVSCSPFRVPIARLLAAHAVLATR
jgi:pyruvate,orthophosphate dikinase